MKYLKLYETFFDLKENNSNLPLEKIKNELFLTPIDIGVNYARSIKQKKYIMHVDGDTMFFFFDLKN